MKSLCVLLTGAVLPGLAGCAHYAAAGDEVSQAVEQWHRTRADEVRGPSGPGGGQGRVPLTGEEGAGGRDAEDVIDSTEATLSDYVAQALERNPSVKAAIAHVQAKLERIPQVTSLSDPVLRAIVRPEPIQTAAGDMYFTLGVGQKFPLPAKLDRAGRMAAADVRMAIEQLNATRLRVIADVEKAYYRLYLTDRSIELAEANRRLLEELEGVVASQYRVGRVQQEDLLRVQMELSSLRNDESRYRRQRESAAAALNQLLDRSSVLSLPETRPIGLTRIDASVEELMRLAGEHNPELAALVHQSERDRAAVELADLGYWPEMDLGVEWTYVEPRDAARPPINPETGSRPLPIRKSEAGDDNWALGVQFNVPIWFERIEAAKREARMRLEKTRHEMRAATNLVHFRIHDAWVQVQTVQDTIRLLQSTLLPQARQTYEVSLASYQGGKADFLTVIENWRLALDFELMLHREMAALETAYSALQREVGLELVRREWAAAEPADVQEHER
ncbi:MAG: TolC family protein [Phycisphaerales bacterium]|nr:MAG: TolC family protein [Phycisphaerales bacterium]